MVAVLCPKCGSKNTGIASDSRDFICGDCNNSFDREDATYKTEMYSTREITFKNCESCGKEFIKTNKKTTVLPTK